MASIFRILSWAIQQAGQSAKQSLNSITLPAPAIPDSIRPVIWILEQAGKCAKKNAQYYYAHPREAYEDLVTYIKENPKEFTLMCILIIGGILTIALPPALGFGAAGIGLGTVAAGWQSAIGSVAAGSLFATLTSMGMTGAFAAIGGSMIAVGLQTPLLGWLLRQLRLFIADASAGIAGLGILPNLPMLQRVLGSIAPADSISTVTNTPWPDVRWFLDPIHTNAVDGASESEGSDTGLINKRVILTNSRAVFDMVWGDLDVATSRTVRQHALLGFDVVIQLIKPRRAYGEEGFYERFEDHDTHCNGCWCVGDVGDI